MNKKFNIDVTEMLKTICSFGLVPNLFPDPLSEWLKNDAPTKVEIILDAAKQLNPLITGDDLWVGQLNIGGVRFLYSGHLHQTEPIRYLANAISALCDRPNTVEQIVRGDVVVILTPSEFGVAYIITMSTLTTVAHVSALGFENLYIIELPPVNLWTEANIPWLLNKGEGSVPVPPKASRSSRRNRSHGKLH